MALEHPGVEHSVAFPGLSINGFVNAPNTGIAFVVLKSAHERAGHEGLDANTIVAGAERALRAGSRTRSWRSFRRRRCRGWAASAASSSTSRIAPASASRSSTRRCRRRSAPGQQQPALAGLFSSFQVSVPQIDAQVDRERAKTYGVALTDVFETLQVYLGSLYVERLQPLRPHLSGERAGRVAVPHCSRSRSRRLKTRNAAGEMVPLGSLVKVSQRLRPRPGDALQRLPGRGDQRRPGARATAPARRRRRSPSCCKAACRTGMAFEWTELAYQDSISGNTMLLDLPALRAARLRACSRRSTRAGRCR